MSQRPSGSLTDLPFLGVGFSATAEEAAAIARSRIEATPNHLPPEVDIGFLNVGVSTLAPMPAGLGVLLQRAGLSSVAHLEELDLVADLDERRLWPILDKCAELEPRWIEEDLGIWLWKGSTLGAHMLPPILDRESLVQATRNVRRVQSAIRVPFLVENPPFYAAFGDMDLLTFMSELAERTGCGLLLDVGHLVGYCTCTGRDPEAYLSTFQGFDSVVEVHLAGFTLRATSRGTLWEDAHDHRIPAPGLELLDAVLERARRVKAITVEVDGSRLDVFGDNIRSVARRVQPIAQEASHV